MSAPRIPLARDVAPAFARVLSRLKLGRGLRAPMSELFPKDETRRAMLGFYADTIGAFGRGLADAVVELHAIENYYYEIGADFDGDRARDIRTCVHIALDRASRAHRHVIARPSSRTANGIC